MSNFDPIFAMAMFTLGSVLVSSTLQAFGARKALQEARDTSTAKQRRSNRSRAR